MQIPVEKLSAIAVEWGYKAVGLDRGLLIGFGAAAFACINREKDLFHDQSHGGAVMTFADVLGAFGGFANLPEGSNGTTTSESKTNFLNAAPEGSIVYGEATPFKVGRRQSVWQTKITLEDGTLVAVVTQTQIVL